MNLYGFKNRKENVTLQGKENCYICNLYGDTEVAMDSAVAHLDRILPDLKLAGDIRFPIFALKDDLLIELKEIQPAPKASDTLEEVTIW